MNHPADDLAALAARIAAGETIDAASVPAELAAQPSVQKLLRFAKVAQSFAGNAGSKPAEPVAPDRIGPWKLLRLLGSGGMGDVWLGERADGTVEHRVAIKRVRGASAAFAQRLEAERRILAKLSHPNIARFIDAGVDATGAPWLALEYIDGETLNAWCERARPTLAERLKLFLAICAAVEHAHRHLVVHRDLKPANVLVDAAGVPHLLDFGVAKLLDGSGGELTAAALTPAYAAPEQLRGGEVSTATDVYALGLLLFRLLAGELPPTRRDAGVAQVLARLDEEETQQPSATARQQSGQLPYAPALLEGDLDAIVSKAIRALPEVRYPSVTELAADVRRHLESRPVSARPPTRSYLFARWARRNALAVGLGSAAALGLVVGAAVAVSQAARAEREADTARRELARAEQVSDFLASLYREQDPLARVGAQSRSPQASLADAVARVDRELATEPLSAARLLRVLGEAQMNLGMLDAARETLERGRALADAAGDALLGAEVDSVSGVLALRELRQDDADRLFTRASSTVAALRGPESLDAARIDSRRAVSLVWLGRFKDARDAAVRADAVFTARLPDGDRERLAARVVLGIVLEQLREEAAAQEALRSAIAGIDAMYGADDARLVQPLQSLGEVLRRARSFDEARALLSRGAHIARTQFGARHVALSNILVRLATIERDSGDARRALAVLDEAEAALPDGEPSARAQLLATRGSTWLELGDGGRAEVDLREAVRLRRETGGLKTGLVWFTQAQWGEALLLQGRVDAADALQAEAARELRELLGPDAYQNALVARRWAQTLEARGDFAAAVAQWREAARLVEKTYGVDHFGLLDMGSRLAAALARLPDGRAEAIALADALLARWQDRSDTDDRIPALRVLRCELVGDAADVAAAGELLRRSGLDVDDDQRAALARCAERIDDQASGNDDLSKLRRVPAVAPAAVRHAHALAWLGRRMPGAPGQAPTS